MVASLNLCLYSPQCTHISSASFGLKRFRQLPTMVAIGVIELANRVELVKSVTIAVGILVVIQVFSYVFRGLQVAEVRLFGSYTFGNLLSLVFPGFRVRCSSSVFPSD
jgi:hypothetical protein